MNNPWNGASYKAIPFVLICLLLLAVLSACGGSSSHAAITPITPITPPPPPTPGVVDASNFGMQCGIGNSVDGHINCQGSPIIWPSAIATSTPLPGLLRLHDAGTYWSELNPQSGTYDFTNLDAWLDEIAAHEPIAVSQVFTWVPCWDSTTGTGPDQNGCGIDPVAGPAGTNGYPNDLTASGSPSFNSFVQAYVTHCSPAGNCVGACPSGQTCSGTNLIQYYEMWNEWDLTYHWTGTMQQVYQMIAPATTIIKQNVSGAVILTPSFTPDSDTGIGYQCDFVNWLNYETQNGKISDWIAWHSYLTNGNDATNTPEVQWATFNQNYVNIQQGGSVNGCSSGSTASGWKNTPWVNSETNFNGSTEVNYQCPSDQYTPDDCTGQIVRWQLLHDSYGSYGLYWYYWLNTIGSNPQYDAAYSQMMTYLVGGTFAGPCSSSGGGVIWTCSFTEGSGTVAQWVWTPNESGTTYQVPTGFVDYMDLQGNKNTVSAGQSINIGVQPFMLEQ